MSSAYATVMCRYRDLLALDGAVGLMNWDQQVLMPKGGGPARTQHVQLLNKMHHELLTSDELSSEIDRALSDASPNEKAQLEILKKDIEQTSKLSLELVQRKSKASSAAYDAWRPCRADANFAPMIPHYTELFDIARETADALGYKDHPYDALIDLYEEGSSYAEAAATLGSIKQPIIDLVREISEQGKPIDDTFLIREWDQPKLKALMERVVGQIGYRMENGRLDLAANAFCNGNSKQDIRMTTRPSEHIRGVVSSSLHEMGHAVYEQNQRTDWDGTPLNGGVSLAVHESQSRTWENVIGRSKPFWTFFWPWFTEEFPELKDHSVNDFYGAYNKVQPSFVRVGADELTYNLHILVRFELEVEIITKQIEIKDLPEAWNSKYQAYLGITPPHDGLGCLQDVHWSRGSVGYFPTYSFGNLIGVQIHEAMIRSIGDPTDMMRAGNFGPMLDWLTKNVYEYGRAMPPKDLVKQVTGSSMDAAPWLAYATNKFRSLYELK
jgi:carboxypeptidase Taq